jgi:hypothetical protein
MDSYSSHVERYTNRPGALVQEWLAKRLILKHFFASSTPPDSVLEIGVGVGRAARCISNLKISYVGVEPTSSLREAAEMNLKDVPEMVTILNLDFSTLSQIEKQFDHTFAIHVLEHASNPLEARQWMEAMVNQTKVGGYISLACPNYFSYGKDFYDGDWTHAYPTTPNRLKALGGDLGLKLVRCSDSRGTFSQPLVRGLLGLIGITLNTRFLNLIGKVFFGVDYLGTGLKVALFWRLTSVTFQK